MKCVDTGKWFCNGRGNTSASHVIQHLVSKVSRFIQFGSIRVVMCREDGVVRRVTDICEGIVEKRFKRLPIVESNI